MSDPHRRFSPEEGRLAGPGALLAAALFIAGIPAEAAASDRVEELVTTICQACHMADGNSVVPLFPKIAGQQASYLEQQLRDWRAGTRVIEPMTPFLPEVDARDVRKLAAYYAAQPPAPGVVQDPALAERGERIYLDGNEDSGVPACEACHEWDGEGNERFPRLAGQHQAYIVKALADYRSGARDHRIMQQIATRLTDSEIEAVAEHIAGLSGTGQ